MLIRWEAGADKSHVAITFSNWDKTLCGLFIEGIVDPNKHDAPACRTCLRRLKKLIKDKP